VFGLTLLLVGVAGFVAARHGRSPLSRQNAISFAAFHDNDWNMVPHAKCGMRAKKRQAGERPGPERVDHSSDTTREKSTGNIISKAPSVTSVAGGVLV
jgi:hypothetical protein